MKKKISGNSTKPQIAQPTKVQIVKTRFSEVSEARPLNAKLGGETVSGRTGKVLNF